MSRIGKRPIDIPAGVQVEVSGDGVSVRGPKGTLRQAVPPAISVEVHDRQAVVKRLDEAKPTRALHGLVRALLANMVRGVSEGFSRALEVHGVGYNVRLQGRTLVMELGFANPVEYALPEGVEAEVKSASNPAVFVLSGCDKQRVGQAAAEIRRLRPAEPYKGKGVRYQGEQIRRKAGKTFASAG